MFRTITAFTRVVDNLIYSIIKTPNVANKRGIVDVQLVWYSERKWWLVSEWYLSTDSGRQIEKRSGKHHNKK
jgi:hypothetical protein